MLKFTKHYVVLFAVTLTTVVVLLLWTTIYQNHCRQVNIYSTCPPETLHQTVTDFTKKTGIKTTVTYEDEANLIAKIHQKKHQHTLDLLITANSIAALLAESNGLLKKLEPKLTKQNAFNQNRYWLPISQDAWVVAFNKSQVDPRTVQNYEDLSSNIWHQQIIFFEPAYQHSYDLLITLLSHNGPNYTKIWFNGLASNLINSKYRNTQEQISALCNGHARLMIINSSALFSALQQNKCLAENIGIIFPNQSTYGTHTSTSAAGIFKYANHKRSAKAFLRYLATQNAQYIYAAQNNEYPAYNDAELPDALKEWGPFKASSIPNNKLACLAKKALSISQPHLDKQPTADKASTNP